jgi:hypothetical protein
MERVNYFELVWKRARLSLSYGKSYGANRSEIGATSD